MTIWDNIGSEMAMVPNSRACPACLCLLGYCVWLICGLGLIEVRKKCMEIRRGSDVNKNDITGEIRLVRLSCLLVSALSALYSPSLLLA